MYKISHEIINIIEKTMKTWRVELTAGGRSLAEAKIQRDIFKGDALSPLLFIIGMIPPNHIFRKGTAVYKLSRSQKSSITLCICRTSNYLQKNEKKKNPETLKYAVWQYSQDIRMEFAIEKYAMLVIKSGKRHLTDRMGLPNQDKIRTKPANIWVS